MNLNESQKKVLLMAAKARVDSLIRKKPFLPVTSDDPQLNDCCGCFVTLKNNGRLRGCIGQFVSDIALIELVQDMAEQAVSADPRFFSDPVAADELEQLDVEISVLSPLKRSDEPLGFELGVDGIFIRKGSASGCFLPQVALETGWSREEFLSYCCSQKAGLKADAWKDPDTEVYLFRADVFGKALRDI